MERMFSKPFIAALEGHADAVEVLSRRPNTITDVASASWDGGAFPGACVVSYMSSDRNSHHLEIILHNSGRRMHLAKITGAHLGKISGLCWADDHRILSCGVDRNIKMWDVRRGASLDPSETGPSQVRFPSLPSSAVSNSLVAKTTRGVSGEGDTSVGPCTLFASLQLIRHLL